MNARFHCLETEQLKTIDEPKRWIWQGYIAAGQITLLTSVWKWGKTTLLAHLLAQRKEASTLAGQATAAGISAVLSEEPATLWRDRHAQLGFGLRDKFFCRPFVGIPSREDWHQLLEHLVQMRTTDGVDLVVIDPLAYFLPGREENNAKLLLEALMPLRRLTDAGLAVLLLHHPRKTAAPEGMTSRGSGMLPAFVDILLEMYPLAPKNAGDRRRRLAGFSRDPRTPRSLVLELSADGRAYTHVEMPPEPDEFTRNWHLVRMVLEDARRELTRQEILEQWPTAFPAPRPLALWRWLNEAVKSGLVLVDGSGRRAEPYRYFLVEKMAIWKDDPSFKLAQTMRDAAKSLPPDGYPLF